MESRLHKKKRFIQHNISGILQFIILPILIILDLFVELYHQIGFRLCHMTLVKRKEYIKIDRHKLKYLNWHEKIACAYCGYANGFIKYVTEILARTETYWCGIKHQEQKGIRKQAHQKNFLTYGDEKTFRKKFKPNKK